MSSILAADLKAILEDVPDDYEIIMNIHHGYPISAEDGKKGWIAYINSCQVDMTRKEVRLKN